MTEAITQTLVPAWIILRSKEPEFLQFLGASTAEEAITRAIKKCSDIGGHIQESELASLKREFLKFAQEAMGLPSNINSF